MRDPSNFTSTTRRNAHISEPTIKKTLKCRSSLWLWIVFLDFSEFYHGYVQEAMVKRRRAGPKRAGRRLPGLV